MAVVNADSTWPAQGKGVHWPDRHGIAAAWAVESVRLMVWTPLLLVLGIWGYFSLAREPLAWLAWPLALGALGAVCWRNTPAAARMLAIVVLGFAAAQLRTHWVATPVLRSYSPNQVVQGIVADLDVRSRQRFSLVVEVTDAAMLPQGERPRRIRVSFTGQHQRPQVGDTVRFTANLAPLPRPAQPGGFDYGRQLFFLSIGAVGRSSSGVEIIEASVPWDFVIRRAFHDLRTAIGERVKASISGPIGSFAVALITGERATIPRAMNNSLQESGLFHILSISGLHMALVAGGAFWVLRALLALSPTLALRWPIKKWAAVFAMGVGLFYMLLADSGPATERSFIMIAIVFFAVLVDRPALSMHNLALAATLILLTAPEQALSASFQMSFMAVMGLAAFFQWWQARASVAEPGRNSGWVLRWTRKLSLLFAASLATSLVAGFLSGIPAAHHFGQLAPYGVIANALALPVVSILVMPFAMASMILMPFGLEVLPLGIMTIGLSLVMTISDWVAAWPGSGLRLPRIGVTEAALLSVGAALLLLPKSVLRVASLPVFATAGALFLMPRSPVIVLVDERAANVAVATVDGFSPALAKQGQASVSRWLQQAGDGSNMAEAFKRPAWTCDVQKCTARIDDVLVTYLLKSATPFLNCPSADILIAQEPLRGRCRGKRATIDRFDVWRNGAYAIHSDVSVFHARRRQGGRPWVYEPRARQR